MKRGGHVIYGGPLGLHSQTMIDYFQVRIYFLLYFYKVHHSSFLLDQIEVYLHKGLYM